MPNLLAVSGAFELLWKCACLQDTHVQGASITETRARTDTQPETNTYTDMGRSIIAYRPVRKQAGGCKQGT
eukprot:5907579-Alexandrium_andersonii.AAC.1